MFYFGRDRALAPPSAPAPLSVFAYRAPTDAEKVSLGALQAGFLALETGIAAYQQDGSAYVPMLQLVRRLKLLLVELVPDGHERRLALERLDTCGERTIAARSWNPDGGPSWVYALDALRECRMWANAGIVLVRKEQEPHE